MHMCLQACSCNYSGGNSDLIKESNLGLSNSRQGIMIMTHNIQTALKQDVHVKMFKCS